MATRANRGRGEKKNSKLLVKEASVAMEVADDPLDCDVELSEIDLKCEVAMLELDAQRSLGGSASA
jgi:hypothetical protein